MKISELINKLIEIKNKYGDLEVCRENPHPPAYYATELFLKDLIVYQDTGMFQNFQYLYLIFETEEESIFYWNKIRKKKGYPEIKNIKGYTTINEDNSVTFTVEYNNIINREILVKKFYEFIGKLNKIIQ